MSFWAVRLSKDWDSLLMFVCLLFLLRSLHYGLEGRPKGLLHCLFVYVWSWAYKKPFHAWPFTRRFELTTRQELRSLALNRDIGRTVILKTSKTLSQFLFFVYLLFLFWRRWFGYHILLFLNFLQKTQVDFWNFLARQKSDIFIGRWL